MMLLAGVHAAILLVLAWVIGGGAAGWLYVIAYAAVCAAGLPLGFALFGRRHGAGWIAGAVLGYGLVAFGWGAVIQLGIANAGVFVVLWLALLAGSWFALRRAVPLVELSRWTRRDTAALLLTLLVVPALAGLPFSRIGSRDDEGQRRYRAYFTADYLWHVALTAELARFDAPPRNPYLSKEPLHYYWTYFNVPAVLSSMRDAAPTDRYVLLNALCAALLFVAVLFVTAWSLIPRAGPVAVAVVLTVTCASAEGLWAIWGLVQRGAPLSALKELNIDAVTSWPPLRSLTIDSLPRSLWYTPQHAFACACGLVALIIAAARTTPRPIAAALCAGVALGLSLVSSPFLGGVFALLYGATAVWMAIEGRHIRRLLIASLAAVPVAAALAWCVGSGTFEGAGGSVAIGFSRRAAAAPYLLLVLALGPILLIALLGLFPALRRQARVVPAILGLAAGLFMLYFVTLTKEPVWIGWRAGQVILVTMPALVAAGLAWVVDAQRKWIAAAIVLLVVLVGLPTTLIDTFNASDVDNDLMGPGFRWTVVVPRDTEAATNWIRASTPTDAIVQMSIGPRGRETWTLIPTFAHRRMAAGQPISLLRADAYDSASRDADAMFATADAAEAWRLAHALGINYVYIDEVERGVWSGAAMDKWNDPRYFRPVYRRGQAEVIQIR